MGLKDQRDALEGVIKDSSHRYDKLLDRFEALAEDNPELVDQLTEEIAASLKNERRLKLGAAVLLLSVISIGTGIAVFTLPSFASKPEPTPLPTLQEYLGEPNLNLNFAANPSDTGSIQLLYEQNPIGQITNLTSSEDLLSLAAQINEHPLSLVQRQQDHETQLTVQFNNQTLGTIANLSQHTRLTSQPVGHLNWQLVMENPQQDLLLGQSHLFYRVGILSPRAAEEGPYRPETPISYPGTSLVMRYLQTDRNNKYEMYDVQFGERLDDQTIDWGAHYIINKTKDGSPKRDQYLLWKNSWQSFYVVNIGMGRMLPKEGVYKINSSAQTFTYGGV